MPDIYQQEARVPAADVSNNFDLRKSELSAAEWWTHISSN